MSISTEPGSNAPTSARGLDCHWEIDNVRDNKEGLIPPVEAHTRRSGFFVSAIAMQICILGHLDMQQLEIAWSDVEGLRQFEDAIRKITSQHDFGNAARRATNRTGDMARTKVVRALAKQTGLKQKLVRRIVVAKRANYDSFSYRMVATGGEMSLRYFKPRETRRGVSAAPFGERKVFAGAFMKGGAFPNRRPLSMGGHVFEREGRGRFPITKLRSGVVVPAEMLRDETARAFRASVQENLARRFAHEINRLTGGSFT